MHNKRISRHTWVLEEGECFLRMLFVQRDNQKALGSAENYRQDGQKNNPFP